MRLRLTLTVVYCVLFATAAKPLVSQVVPSAHEGELPFSAGGGYSNFNVDWGQSRMDGGTVWLDYDPNLLIPGLGFEVEARDLSTNRGSNPPNFREDTAGVGMLYT